MSSRDFVVHLYGIEQAFIEAIRKTQSEFIIKYGLGNITSKNQALIDKLYTSQ